MSGIASLERLAGLLARPVAWARATAPRRYGVLAVAMLVYVLGLLWPYGVKLPELLPNGAAWTEDGTLRFARPGLAVTREPPAWPAEAKATGRLRVALRARSFAADQSGPARLLTVSRDTYAQNVLVGQRGSDLVARVLTACRARSTGCERELRLPGVFAGPGWVDIELWVEPGRAILRAGDATAERSIPQDPLRVWSLDQRLALGNDVSGHRPWLGEIARATVETPGGSVNALDPAELRFPEAFWSVGREPMLVPFRDASRDDMILNLALYAPLGALFALLFERSTRHVFWVGSGFILVMSSGLEIAQLFFERRNPSVTDALLNTIGGALAVGLLCHREELWRRAVLALRRWRALVREGR